MLEIITDLPDRVLGLKAVGEVTSDDYQAILVPALDGKLAKSKKVRLLYVLGSEFQGYTGGAAWEDAKIGMKHLNAFERVAVVTDVDWIRNMVKAFGFAIFGEVRVFDNGDVDEARKWISEPAATSGLRFELIKDKGVLILEPRGELEPGDFDRLEAALDPYLAEAGELRGLMIVVDHFPGWDGFAALSSHLRFVKDHHKKIRKLAFVTDDRLLTFLPRISAQFLIAETRAFPMANRDEALLWVGEDH